MTTSIEHAETDEQIAATFCVMQQLWPDLVRTQYVQMIRSLMTSEGLRLLALRDGTSVRAVASYRVMNMLYTGRLLYVDDLVSDQAARSRGHGAQLIARLKDEGRKLGCNEIQLISSSMREQAHRFYAREGFDIEYLHFRARLS